VTSEATIAKIEGLLPRLIKDSLQRAGIELAVFVERHIDEQGPRKYPSQSSRWGSQSGRGVRSFAIGQDENIFEISVQGKAAMAAKFGTRVYYIRFLEEGTEKMRSRPAVNPGMDDWARERMPKLLQDILVQVSRIINV